MEANPLVKKQLKPMVEGWRGAGLVDDATARRLLAAISSDTASAPPAAPERLLTRREVADLLQVCPRTVDALRATGRLPTRQIGAHSVRFLAQDVSRLARGEE